ncbi:hypothetical protein RCT32_00085 [Escherichia coli]|nr:hypothetical protein [Escherichia coli]
MNLLFKVTISCFMILFPALSFAVSISWCNILWSNDNNPSVKPVTVLVNGNNIIKTPITIVAGGPSTAISSYSGGIPFGAGGITRYWIQYPSGWFYSNRLRYRITSALGNPDTSIPQGTMTKVTPSISNYWPQVLPCYGVNAKYSFPFSEIQGIEVEIAQENAYPGVYSLELPIKVGFEENKGLFEGDSYSGWRRFPEKMYSVQHVSSQNFNIVINSECKLDADKINFEFGDVTDRDMLSGITKSINLGISCSNSARVRLTAHNIQNNLNTTNCGPGTCTLTFDSGKSDEVFNFNSAGHYNIKLNNYLKSSSPSAGHFSANMVLSFLII